MKGRNNFKLNTNIHPFVEGFDNDCTFDFELEAMRKLKYNNAATFEAWFQIRRYVCQEKRRERERARDWGSQLGCEFLQCKVF